MASLAGLEKVVEVVMTKTPHITITIFTRGISQTVKSPIAEYAKANDKE